LSTSKVYENATAALENARGSGRLTPIVSAIVAVLAAIGSPLANHESIQALDIKNHALHDTIKASDQIADYQTKWVSIGTYNALLAADVARDAKGRESLKAAINHEEAASLAVLGDAKKLEASADEKENRAQAKLRSFETFEIATATFEVSIVLASISALTRARVPLWTAFGLSAIGIVALVVAYVQGI